MTVAMRGNFVSSCNGFADEVRKALTYPAKKEARHLHVVFAEDVQQLIEISFDP